MISTFSVRRAFGILLLLLGSIGIWSFLGFQWSKVPHRIDVQIVLSTYRESQELVSEQISSLRRLLAQYGWSTDVVVYSKDENLNLDQMESTRQKLGADVLIKLPNVGREGGTLHVGTLHELTRSN
jgi:hypothetical protein